MGSEVDLPMTGGTTGRRGSGQCRDLRASASVQAADGEGERVTGAEDENLAL